MNLVNIHPYGFRCGELAEVLGLEWFNNRWCYHVRYNDSTEDYVALEDWFNYDLIWT